MTDRDRSVGLYRYIDPNPEQLAENPPEHPGERWLKRMGACVDHEYAEPSWWTDVTAGSEIYRGRKVPSGRPYMHVDRRPGRTNAMRQQMRYLSKRQNAVLICRNECPVRDLCQKVGDHVEGGSVGGEDQHYFTGIWAGEGPYERAQRRRAAREEADGEAAARDAQALPMPVVRKRLRKPAGANGGRVPSGLRPQVEVDRRDEAGDGR